AVHGQMEWAANRPWRAKDYPHVAAWLMANEKSLAVALEAARRPEYFNPLIAPRSGKEPTSLITALVPAVVQCRELTSALTARAMLRVGEGKPDAAWQDLVACHRLGRLLGRGGSLIEGLTGIAIDRIAGEV